jgi:hypothetical protein
MDAAEAGPYMAAQVTNHLAGPVRALQITVQWRSSRADPTAIGSQGCAIDRSGLRWSGGRRVQLHCVQVHTFFWTFFWAWPKHPCLPLASNTGNLPLGCSGKPEVHNQYSGRPGLPHHTDSERGATVEDA